jgi:hypothetical protein
MTFRCTRMRVLACLVALGCVHTASARMESIHCLRGSPGNHTQSHACTGLPRTDRAGNGRVR